MNNTERIADLLLPRKEEGHKGSFGTLTVLAGSSSFRGAAVLNCAAALASGVGIVRLCSVEPVLAAAAASLAEPVYTPIAANGTGSMLASSLREQLPAVNAGTAVLLGSGMTSCPDTAAIVKAVLAGVSLPLVMDADGLNVLAGQAELLRTAAQPPVITPHVGEMARLTGLSLAEIKNDPIGIASDFSVTFRCVTVLKDAVTHIGTPEGRVITAGIPNSGMGKGGSGDVLSGILASLLAQGYPPVTAAELAVRLHAEAGQLARQVYTPYAMRPTHLVEALPRVFSGALSGGLASASPPESGGSAPCTPGKGLRPLHLRQPF